MNGSAPALWNPNAAANWSLIFTPAFGSYLQTLNWRALGEEQRARASIAWFYVSLAMLGVYIVLALAIKDQHVADVGARALALSYLVVWYVAAGRSQARYVKAKFGSDYPRRPWGKALLIGVAALVGYVVVAVLAGAVFALVR